MNALSHLSCLPAVYAWTTIGRLAAMFVPCLSFDYVLHRIYEIMTTFIFNRLINSCVSPPDVCISMATENMHT